MSIIMDALKKAQNTNSNINTGALNTAKAPVLIARKKFRPKFCLGLFAIFLLIVFLLFVVFRPRVPPAPRPKTISPEELIRQIKEQDSALSIRQAEVAQNQPLSSLVLKGIVLGDGDSYAIIGGKIVKAGQEVAGAVVKEIRIDEVVLSFDGKEHIIKLSQ